jgi:uncharacterized membrane protein YccC
MNVRHWSLVAAVLAIGIVAGRTTGTAAQDEKPKYDFGQLTIQVADAKLKLAQMNLQRMQELNNKVRGTLITGMVEQFTEEVELAERELKAAKSNPGGDPFLAALERMRLALRSAEDREKRALATYEKAPDIVTKGDIERLRQVAVVADLQLQRGLALEGADAGKQVQWQIDVFASELDRVRVYCYLLGQNRFGEFAPGL